jgi:subtilisin family serine protease
MAGAIAARGQVKGVAPSAHILSARAFDSDGAGGALGSTLTIIKAIDWSVHSGARILNMSFAGPRDPALHDVLAQVARKGVVMIGAAGNAGPKSPPLYPAADENVIAITATDDHDRLYPMANLGPYVAVAAPGVDVLLPAPNGGYALETGTSVSAALASGVAALTLERRPDATPKDVKKWFTLGARPLTPAGEDPVVGAGAGEIDATTTVNALGPQP